MSKAGKEVLIKAVLQAIPSYIMSCFSLPGYLIDSIESAIRSFWWGDGEKKKLAWVAWSQLCKPKSKGGLGFRDLRSFNLALLAKQGWRLITHQESLMARVFKARYYPHGTFLEAGRGSRPSATWSAILKARSLLAKGLRIRIGNGYSTEIWDSPWIHDDGNFKLYTPRNPLTFYPMHVADLINPLTYNWNQQVIDATFWPIDRERILSIPIGAITSDDRLVWHYAKDGTYSVKSAYQLAFAAKGREVDEGMGTVSGEQGVKWDDIWSLEVPPKIRLFVWRAWDEETHTL